MEILQKKNGQEEAAPEQPASHEQPCKRWVFRGCSLPSTRLMLAKKKITHKKNDHPIGFQ